MGQPEAAPQQAPPTLSVQAPEPYTVSPEWRRGDRMDYLVALTPDNGSLDGEVVEVQLTVTVIKATPDLVVLEFDTEPPPHLTLPRNSTAALNFEFDPQVRFGTGIVGHELHNFEEGRAWLDRYAKAHMREMRLKGAPRETIERLKSVYEGFGEDRRLLLTSVFKHPSLFMAVLGKQGFIGAEMTDNQPGPNPFGEGFISSSRTLSVERVGDRHLRFHEVVRPDTRELMESFVAMVDRTGGKPFPERFVDEAVAAGAANTLEIEFILEERSGWPEIIESRNIFHDGTSTKVTEQRLRRFQGCVAR